MNQTQKKYAMERLSEIRNKKFYKIDTKFGVPAVGLAWSEKIKLIRAGKVKLKGGKIQNYIAFCEGWNWGKYDKSTPAQAKKLKAKSAANQALATAYDKCRDEVMLGDEEKAVKLIQEFSKS